MPNITNKKWLKEYSDDRGYGSDESKTMSSDSADGTTHRTGGSGIGRTTQSRAPGRKLAPAPTKKLPAKKPPGKKGK